MATERTEAASGSRPSQRCLDAEVLAAYVDGALAPDARREVEQHLTECDDCRAFASEAALLAQEPLVQVETPFVAARGARPPLYLHRSVQLLALAASISLVAWLAPSSVRQWFGGADGQEMQALIQAVAAQPTRPVTGRLSGEFAYAAPPSSVRGGEPARAVSPEVRVAAAAVERTAAARGVEGQAALGIAYLVGGDLDEAIAALQRACAQRPATSTWWNDLGVAYLARAERTRSGDDNRLALDAIDRALGLTPASPAARFNRALALERLGRTAEASAAWTDVQRLSPDSPWAAEAAAHVAPLAPR